MGTRWVGAGRTGIPLLMAMCAVFVAGALSTSALAQATGNVQNNERFELGDGVNPLVPGVGDILGDGAQPGPDWSDLFAAGGQPKDAYNELGEPVPNGVPDFLDIFSGLRGRRDAGFLVDDVSAGTRADASVFVAPDRVGSGIVDSLYDLGNAYAYTTFDDQHELILYAGLERLAPGRGSIVFEFTRVAFALDEGGRLTGTRTVGDLKVEADYPAGILESVHLYRWGVVSESTGATGWIAVDTLPIDPSDPAEQCNGAGTLCAVCNGTTVDGGDWQNYDAAGNVVPSLGSDLFLEFGLNLTRVTGLHTYQDYYGTRYAGISITSYDDAATPAPKDLALGSFYRASKLAR